MQITERNCPPIAALMSKELKIRTGAIDEKFLQLYQAITYMWEKNHHIITSNVFMLTKKIEDLIDKNDDKLRKLASEEFLKEKNFGTILTRANAYCYFFDENGFVLYFFRETLEAFIWNTYEGEKRGMHIWTDMGGIYGNCKHRQEVEFGVAVFRTIPITLLFLKYAKIETKELKPGKKETFSNDKWINNTRQNITIVDSLWFTTLVNSGAFNVRGHFRLQPYKDRKELIWISEFEKKGYTRKAKKLSFYPDEENEQLQPLSL